MIGNKPIATLTKQHIFTFLTSITSYSNSVIEKVYLQLKIAYADALSNEIIDRNLMTDPELKRPKSKKEDKKVVSLTENEQKIFLGILNKHKVPVGRNNYKNQLLIELYTGLRMGEVNALRTSDIDFERRLIKVRRTISQGEHSRPFISESTKTYAGIRDVPMSKDAEVVLRNAIAAAEPNKENLIFYDYKNKHMVTTNQVNNFFNRLCAKAELEVRGQHSLRHTFATRCIEANVQPIVLKNWMGHTDIHVTLDTYADVFERMHNGV